MEYVEVDDDNDDDDGDDGDDGGNGDANEPEDEAEEDQDNADMGFDGMEDSVKQMSTEASSKESPAGAKLRQVQFLKQLSNSEEYQQALTLIKYSVS